MMLSSIHQASVSDPVKILFLAKQVTSHPLIQQLRYPQHRGMHPGFGFPTSYLCWQSADPETPSEKHNTSLMDFCSLLGPKFLTTDTWEVYREFINHGPFFISGLQMIIPIRFITLSPFW